MFLYCELYQQFPNFPRKALDLDLDLCAGVELGKVSVILITPNDPFTHVKADRNESCKEKKSWDES